eukprot:5227562-Karenia_brevis.AAC.1
MHTIKEVRLFLAAIPNDKDDEGYSAEELSLTAAEAMKLGKAPAWLSMVQIHKVLHGLRLHGVEVVCLDHAQAGQISDGDSVLNRWNKGDCTSIAVITDSHWLAGFNLRCSATTIALDELGLCNDDNSKAARK